MSGGFDVWYISVPPPLTSPCASVGYELTICLNMTFGILKMLQNPSDNVVFELSSNAGWYITVDRQMESDLLLDNGSFLG